jgi:hypothetical protein
MKFIKIIALWLLMLVIVTLVAVIEFSLQINPDYVLLPNIFLGSFLGIYAAIKSIEILDL